MVILWRMLCLGLKLSSKSQCLSDTMEEFIHARKIANLQKLDYSVPDWSQVRRKGLAVRRDLRDALSNLVCSLTPDRLSFSSRLKCHGTNGRMAGHMSLEQL